MTNGDNIFDGRAFETWQAVVLGALGFAALFEVIYTVATYVIIDSAPETGALFLLGVGAFGGYVLAVGILKIIDRASD